MSKFHSMVSRRDFMKGLGLAGAGLGAASLVAPVFHDLDEVLAAPKAIQKRPWYVKERELLNPSVEVDWDMMQRFDRRRNGQTARAQAIYYGKDRVLSMTAKGNEKTANKVKTFAPGYSLKWQALGLGRTRPSSASHGWVGHPKKGITPEERGVPKWTGTPEEGSRMLTAAARYFGAGLVGYAELDNTWRNKLILKYSRGKVSGNDQIDAPWPPPDTLQKPYVYEDVDKGYEGEAKYVIPSKNMYAVVLAGLDSQSMSKARTAEGGGYFQTNGSGALGAHGMIHDSMINFLGALGNYQFLDDFGHGSAALNWGAATVMTGIAEQSRQNCFVLTPEYASFINPGSAFTDLPVAPSAPIDAGMWRFCADCGKCAVSCPAQVISHDKKPTWEVPQIEGKDDTTHNRGVKAFWTNMTMCRIFSAENGLGHGCGTCQGECVFAQDSAAMVHSVIKGTVSTVGVFNGFFANMGELFGYGNYDPENWWDMSLPAYGIDTMAVAWKGK